MKKEKEIKVKNLHELMKTAKELNLPVVPGTEMNKYGQKFVDDFNVPELKSYIEYFRQSSFFVYGHAQMGQFYNKGYNSKWAKSSLHDSFLRNKFYAEAGKRKWGQT